MVHFCLEETLPREKRKPFRWRGSNPLSFLTLFNRGPKLRSYAWVHLWHSLMSGSNYNSPIYVYEQLHTQTLFNWSLAQRGWYRSFASLCSFPGSWASGKMLQKVGPGWSLLVGQACQSLEMVLTGLSTRGWQLYATRPLYGLSGYSGILASSMAYSASSIGAESGVSEGQLQSSLFT